MERTDTEPRVTTADAAVAERALLESAASAHPPAYIRATVVAEVGAPVTWTSRIENDRIEIAEGSAEHPDVRILSDPETLAAVCPGGDPASRPSEGKAAGPGEPGARPS